MLSFVSYHPLGFDALDSDKFLWTCGWYELLFFIYIPVFVVGYEAMFLLPIIYIVFTNRERMFLIVDDLMGKE